VSLSSPTSVTGFKHASGMKTLGEEAQGDAPGRGRLAGRRVLVVGGGQNDYGLEDPPMGNGRAMSILFAREGAAVVVGDIDRAAAEATAGMVDGDTTVVEGDASTEEGVSAMISGAGEIDGLVLNVGIGAGFLIRGTSVEEWDRVMAVNLRSAFLGCKLGLEAMGERGGAIVMIGSVAAREVMPWPAYSASKVAMEALARQASAEGAPDVRVNVLHPGLIDTPLGRMASQVSSRREQVRIPARRQGTAWEVAYAALFLLSGEASYVTGQSLLVDGGLSTAPRG
jgi:NAD(P)-dependent dehydrogenase (short-subunit alcohol dehydrogenase family)